MKVQIAIAFTALVIELFGAAKEGTGEASSIETDYADMNAVLKEFNPKTCKRLCQGDGSWLEFAYPKGGQTRLTHNHKNKLDLKAVDLRFLDIKKDKITSSDYFTKFISNYPKIGSIIAYPRSDFEVEEQFTYLATDKDGHKVAAHGMLVNVKIILGYPAGATKLPTELVCQKTVDNLGSNGMPIPDTVGKAGKIKSLVASAKLRYGASSAKVFTASNEEGKVQILLLGVDAEKAKENIIPAVY